ncbi:MAG: KpsF/GutQ family sugar-phosphate isomerase [Sphingobacteriales bacterium]|nr:KpsF/GutQ family sugar-phosphate isomerase [Sphingobacteriales bacterium]
MKTEKEILDIAKRALQNEADALLQLQNQLNTDFYKIVQLLYESKGRVVVTGIGKSAIIANKMVATFNSTGTPSLFMHAADAIHGDLGMIQQHDVIICISKSGNTPEIKVLAPLLKQSGNTLIAMVGNIDSYLAKQADYILDTTVESEACPNNLAPTTSTTAQLAMGDALAVCLLETREFKAEDFAKYHPGGALGKKLYLKVGDLSMQNEKPSVDLNENLSNVILEITSKRLGMTSVLNGNELVGVITDGDLRRLIAKGFRNDLLAKDIMGSNPKTIQKDELAVLALEMMKNNNITQLIVMDGNSYEGVIHLHDLIREGIL